MHFLQRINQQHKDEQKLKMGMVGGGTTGYRSDPPTGGNHGNMASWSADASARNRRSLWSQDGTGLPDERIYSSLRDVQEMALPETERMDFVVIVTPNKLHFEPA